MKLRFVDKVEIQEAKYCAAYFPKIQTIEIDRHLPGISKLNCFLHEIPHVVNHLFLGSNYLDFMWDTLNLLMNFNFSGIAQSHKYYFGSKWKFVECPK